MFSQNASCQIIYDKWSGEKFPFKIGTSYYDTSYKAEFGSSIYLLSPLYNKREDVIKTTVELGYGQIEPYRIPSIEKNNSFQRIVFENSVNLVQVNFLKTANFHLREIQ